MKEPKRLADCEGMPETLQEALRGLGRGAPSADAVARVQSALSALPGPTPPTPPGGLSLGWGAGAYTTAAAAVAVIAVAAGLSLRATPSSSLPDVQHLPLPAAELQPTAPTIAAPAASEPAEETSPQQRAPAAGRTRHARGHHARAAAAEPADTTAAMQPTAAFGATQTEPAARAATPVEPIHAQRQPPGAHDKTAKTRATDVAPEDEAGLLYRAKKAARTDKHAAFRMLEQHAAHFPRGALVEEREVLAIDLLRHMGREQEAKLRATQFQQHFPHSSYRSGIAH